MRPRSGRTSPASSREPGPTAVAQRRVVTTQEDTVPLRVAGGLHDASRAPSYHAAVTSMAAEPDGSAPSATSAAGAHDYVHALVASFLGWTLDAFDFFLVVITLPAIAQDFGVDNSRIALSIAVTLGFRPVGAFLFGLLADRYGRRLPLMIDLVFFSIVEVLSGL